MNCRGSLGTTGGVVAQRGLDRYPSGVRKFFWQRWALVFLLMSRLVIGELGHAMPIAHSADMGVAPHHQMAASEAAACSEHEGGGQSMPAAHHDANPTDDDTSTHSSGEQDCCKSGECECPCLHVPCATLEALVLNPVATNLLRSPQGVEGLVSQRPSGLFRPPA